MLPSVGGWTYSEGNREKRGIRVHEECQAGTQWSWKAQSGWTERRIAGRTRKQGIEIYFVNKK